MAVTMTTRQRQRRDDVVAAVHHLVAERGIDGLQMRDVCERSGVALATVYRYFSSKDHLVAEALMAWAGRLEHHVDLVAAELEPADRLAEVLRRGVQHLERHPQFAGMLLAVSTSPDPRSSEVYLRLGARLREALARTIPEVDPQLRDRTLQVLGAVWYHAIVEWVGGRIPAHEIHGRLASTARLLLAPRAEVGR